MSITVGTNLPKNNDNIVFLYDADNIKSYSPTENLITYSEDLSNASYNKTVATYALAGGPPSGPSSSYLVTNTTTANFDNITRTYTTSTLTAYTFSVYVKAGTQTNVSLLIGTNGYNTAAAGGCYFRNVFNMTTKAFSSDSLTKYTTDTITIDKFTYGYVDIGNGWFRLWFTADLTAYANVTSINVGIYAGTYGSMIAANGTSMWLSGYMLDSTKSLNPYVATTTSVITKPNTISDISKTATTGTLQNNPIFNSNYIEFNGTNQSISFPSLTQLQFLNKEPYTFNVWVNTISVNATTWPGIINRESNPGTGRDGYNLYMSRVGQSAGNISISTDRFILGTNNGVYYALAETEILNKWLNICLTYDGAYSRIYVNGIVVGTSGVSSGNLSNTSATFQIGARNTDYGNYKIGYVAAYNKTLTGSDVLSNFNALKSRFGV